MLKDVTILQIFTIFSIFYNYVCKIATPFNISSLSSRFVTRSNRLIPSTKLFITNRSTAWRLLDIYIATEDTEIRDFFFFSL
jgi:hypothetical protein